MIWAACSSQFSWCNLVVMQRHKDAKNQGYSLYSYIKAMEEELLQIWQPGLLFLQDNAPMHTTKIVRT